MNAGYCNLDAVPPRGLYYYISLLYMGGLVFGEIEDLG
jgi:hypothetical protein